MTAYVTFPIPTAVLDPVEYPEFKGNPGDAGPATEWRATATHLQARPVGGGDEDWVDVVALSEITGPSGVPEAHKTSHATGGTDAMTPADIGAAPSTILTGATSIAVVSEMPASPVPGVVYLVYEVTP